MNIIELAKKAGFETDSAGVWITDGFWTKELERFAALVQAEQEWVDLTDDEIHRKRMVMNERIKKLATEVGMSVEYLTNTKQIVLIEKFAELIVRECVSVMKSTVDESIDFDRKLDETSSWIERDIKKHFGVEE